MQAGTGYLDYGARMYMPEVGRWAAVDPLAEKWNQVSTYNFTLNNPLNLLDPDGQDVIEHADRTEYTGEDAAAMGTLYGAGKGDSGGNQGTEDKDKKGKGQENLKTGLMNEKGQMLNDDGSTYQKFDSGMTLFSDNRASDDPTRIIDAILSFFSPFKALEGFAAMSKKIRLERRKPQGD